MESLVSSVTFLRDFIVDKTSCQCPPFAHQRGQELNSSFSCEHNEETLTWYPCTLADKWGSRNFPKYQCPYFHDDTDMAAPCCMVLYPFTSVHFTSYLFWGSPHFYVPFWALGIMVAFAVGLANKVICTGTGGHYRRIVASRKHTTFCHRLEGQSKAKHFPAPTSMNSQSLKNSSANKQLAIAARKLSMPFLAAGSMCFPSWTLERSICRAALYTDPGN